MKCSNCVFHDVYRDKDICLMHSDLDKAVRACTNSDRCLFRLSLKDAVDFVLKRGSKDER